MKGGGNSKETVHLFAESTHASLVLKTAREKKGRKKHQGSFLSVTISSYKSMRSDISKEKYL